MKNDKTKAHTRYTLSDKTQVPGVTTITKQLGWNTEVLVKWANNLGLSGISSSRYMDDKADIGTLAHAMITDGLLNKETDTSDYSANQISSAENSVLSFFEWAKPRNIVPVLVEEPLVSEFHHFGGTPDIYGEVDGTLEVIDIKTGSGIYDEMVIQTSAYAELLEENGHKVDRIRILNIPRTEDEAFLERIVGKKQREAAWKIFLNCLDTYHLKKLIKSNGR